MTAKPILYSYWRSSAAWRVRIAMAMKGLDYEFREVHLWKDQQSDPEYTQLNPMGQVPCLIIDGLTLTQSLPIIEYLDETRSKNKILPEDPAKRYYARQIAEIINSGTQPVVNLSIQRRLEKITDENFVKIWVNEHVTKGFFAVESILKQTSGQYCVGDNVTMADLVVVPQLYNALHFKVDMSQFPIFSQVIKNLYQLEPFIKADAANQPDSPESKKVKNWNALIL